MLAGMLTALGWKMAIYVAVLVGFSYALVRATRQRDEARKLLDFEKIAHRATCDAMADQRLVVDHWRKVANESTAQALLYQGRAAEGKARFDALTAKLQATPVPGDAEGALAWMAEVAKDLAAGVGR